MSGRSDLPRRACPEAASGARPESYGKLVANLGGVLIALAAIAWAMAIDSKSRPTTPGPASVTTPKPQPAPMLTASAEPVPAPKVVAAPPPSPPEPPKLDRAAVAAAEAALDAASRDRARADARAEDAARRLDAAARQAVDDARAVKSLAFRVRDPSARIAAAKARGGFLRAERDRLKGEIATLAGAPRPKAKVLSNKNPVARPSDGQEHHFELRRNRVTSIELDRLLELVKTDARLRIRLTDGARVVDSRVGPIGAFSLQYSLIRALPAGLEELMERRGVSYDLRGWEVVPEFEGRGETFEATRQPISGFARALSLLDPAHDVVTLWIYPDAFDLYRKLRDDLHARGFVVAARPLPDGMPIRGSPGGSLSAGQ